MRTDFDPMTSILLSIGDWLVAAGMIPSMLFLFHYGIWRPIKWKNRDNFKPWYKSFIGRLIFFMALAQVAMSLVVVMSLFLGIDYPGRPFVRIIGYAIFLYAAIALPVTYMRESQQANVNTLTKHMQQSTLMEEKTGPHPGVIPPKRK